MALIKCPECGKEISDKAKKCPNCGHVLTRVNDDVEKLDETEKFTAIKENHPKKNNKVIALLVGLCAISLCGNVIQFAAFNKNGTEAVNKKADIPLQTEQNSVVTSEKTTENADESISTEGAEISFKYIDTAVIPNGMKKGTYKVGIDVEAGDYIVYGLYQLGGVRVYNSLGEKDNAKYLQGLFLDLNLQDGQYIDVVSGVLLSKELFDETKLSQYGIYKVGDDLPAGEYKISSIESEYKTEYGSVFGALGAYEVADTPFGGDGRQLENVFDEQKYTELQEGDYLRIVGVALYKVN